ncbi:hypothetical protein DPMN_106893 [Dreissena polymorpha]|uniref:Uncharacterized protein n=1 Tax=Dreissena polymorpha TaxID=45954 RepID=A0A9D4QKH3_DREPO|nr:hypothetical protein DPMN_106893 [Dreissena polymorpha]
MMMGMKMTCIRMRITMIKMTVILTDGDEDDDKYNRDDDGDEDDKSNDDDEDAGGEDGVYVWQAVRRIIPRN